MVVVVMMMAARCFRYFLVPCHSLSWLPIVSERQTFIPSRIHVAITAAASQLAFVSVWRIDRQTEKTRRSVARPDRLQEFHRCLLNRISGFPSDLRRRPYNTVRVCDVVFA